MLQQGLTRLCLNRMDYLNHKIMARQDGVIKLTGQMGGISFCGGLQENWQHNVPIILRLQGIYAEEGAKIIEQSGLTVYSAIVLKDATQKLKRY